MSYITLRDEEGSVSIKIHRLCFTGHLPSSLCIIFQRMFTNLLKYVTRIVSNIEKLEKKSEVM
jgi:hypothetical protein